MIYELIENGVEFERKGIVVHAIGEIEDNELKVKHLIFQLNERSSEPSALEMADLEEIAYFIISSGSSFVGDVAVLEMLFAAGVHPADALIAYQKAKSRVVWGEVMEAIWQQCMPSDLSKF